MTCRRGAALISVLAALAGCTTGAAETAPAPAPTDAPRWSRTADGPLSARTDATAVWTGREVLVFGGERRYCPPGSTCDYEPGPAFRDGAAYDPTADSWRSIAAVPVAIRTASTALLDGTVYALLPRTAKERSSFLAYDIAADTWKRLPRPPRGAYSLAAVGETLIASRQWSGPGPDDWRWDPAARTWRALPDSPGKLWDLRQVVDAGGTALLLGQVRVEGSKRNQGYLAALRLDPRAQKWSRVTSPAKEDRPGTDGSPWFVVGGRAVSASTHGDRYGDSGLLGGFVHPRDGWSPLPAFSRRELPITDDRWQWAQAAGGGYVVAGRFALDVANRAWEEIAALPELADLGGAPAVAWAGDRLFVWGGQQDPAAPARTGWTWRPRG